MKIRRQIKTLVMVAVLAISVTLSLSIKTNAIDYGKGFFSGQDTASGVSAGFVLRNCKTAGDDALKDVVDASDKKEALITLMWNYYNGCGKDESSSDNGDADFNSRRNRVGARYIIWTMTGQTPDKGIFKDGNGSFITSKVASSAAPFDYWKSLLRQSNVTVEYNQSYTTDKNSGYAKTSNGQRDVYRFTQTSAARRAIEIYQDGNLKYVIRVECANPLGTSLKKIDPPAEEPPDVITPPTIKEEDKLANWSLGPMSLVKKCVGGLDAFCLLGTYQTSELTVISGDQVNWAHRVYNTGPDRTDATITTKRGKQTQTKKADGTWSAGTWSETSDSRYVIPIVSPGIPKNGYIPGPLLLYSTFWRTLDPKTQTIKSDGSDIDKKFCQRVSANPKSSKNDNSTISTPVCVKVRQSWFLKADTVVDKAKVSKGGTGKIKWTHKATNEGPSKVSVDKDGNNVVIQASIKRASYKEGAEFPVTTTTAAAGIKDIKDKTKSTTKSVTSELPIASIGNDIVRVCEWLTVTPESSESQATLESEEKCVDVESGWEIEPSTTVTGKAMIGNEITWTHKVKNNGPSKTDKAVEYKSSGSGSKTMASGKDKGYSEFFNEKWTVPNNAEPEDKFCRSTKAEPTSSSDSGEKTSAQACVQVPYNYELTPGVKSISSTPTPGTTIAVQPTVKNASPNDKPATKSEKVDWALKVDINDGPQTTIGNDQKVFEVGDGQTVATVDYTLPSSIQFGDKVCFSLSLSKTLNNGETGAQGGPGTSAKVCVQVGKRPKIQVLGGDIWADGSITTNIDRVGDKFVGSWAEYGAIASGSISGLATGGALGNQENICSYSLLSFTNQGCDTSGLGSYSFSSSSLDVSKFFDFSSPVSVPTIELSDTSLNKYKLTTDVGVKGVGPITGTKVIYAPSSTVTISGNIEYSNSPIMNLNSIPQVVIIAKNIKIDDNVTRVDAWLVAEGEVNTCASVNTEGDLTKDKCLEQLQINGPLRAHKTKFHRIFGSNDITTQGDPAEVIKFRPDAHLWAFNHINQGFSIKSTYIIDQPVRF